VIVHKVELAQASCEKPPPLEEEGLIWPRLIGMYPNVRDGWGRNLYLWHSCRSDVEDARPGVNCSGL